MKSQLNYTIPTNLLESSKEPKEMKKPSMKWAKLDNNHVVPTSYLLLIHMLCIFAPFHFNWNAFWFAFALAVVTGMTITVSYHRNLSHKSFTLPKWLEYLLAYCAAHASQGDPIGWVSIHRYHHRYIDSERDPHSSIEGFWFSYIAWILDLNALNKKVQSEHVSDFRETTKDTVFFQHENQDNVDDLRSQLFYRLMNETYLLHPIALAVLLYAIGGIPFVLWGLCARTVAILHITFLVNGICHRWGKRQWNCNDLSKNNWFMGILTLGEGWHNNHHAFEYSAKFGLEWWQIDFGWYFIRFLEAIGLAMNVKLPSEAHKQKLALKIN